MNSKSPPLGRVPCSKCGALILPITAERTGGLCMPCLNRSEAIQEPTSFAELLSKPQPDAVERLAEAFRRPTNSIRNCAVEFRRLCPLDWTSLERTDEKSVRFCQACRQNVFLCASDAEALAHARQGHCIAMPGEDGSIGPLAMRVGMPKEPLTPEQEASVRAYQLDNAKTKALQALKYSSRFCPQCGYPCPDWKEFCRVCRHRVGVVKQSG